jgi:hypothetical protein
MYLSNSVGMKTRTFGMLIVVLSLLFSGASRAGAGAITEELAVVQALAKLLNDEAAARFDFLYHESDFSARKNVTASLTDPDRTQFCGLTRDQGLALVREITFLDMEPVEFDKAVAKVAGLGLGHKQMERFRYLRVSRVVFGPDSSQAWVAADLNGESGAVYRLDKVNGAWSRTSRCGGWVKAD